MKKLIVLMFMALFLMSCDDGDDSSPADISGYWQGGGTVTENAVVYPVAMQAELRATGYGYYDVYMELQSGAHYEWAYAVWFYQNGQINTTTGRIGSVNGNTIEIDKHGGGIQFDVTLYRYGN